MEFKDITVLTSILGTCAAICALPSLDKQGPQNGIEFTQSYVKIVFNELIDTACLTDLDLSSIRRNPDEGNQISATVSIAPLTQDCTREMRTYTLPDHHQTLNVWFVPIDDAHVQMVIHNGCTTEDKYLSCPVD